MLNISIGVDIEDIDRFSSMTIEKNGALFNKIFTPNELDYCISKVKSGPHLAARFAGKEAVVKALSNMGNSIPDYKDIEILNNEKGIPLVLLKNNELSKMHIKISLSHCSDKAIAFVVILYPDTD